MFRIPFTQKIASISTSSDSAASVFPPPSCRSSSPQPARQSQQWLDPGIYERSSLISLGQERHKGGNQRHTTRDEPSTGFSVCFAPLFLFLWPVKLRQKWKNQICKKQQTFFGLSPCECCVSVSLKRMGKNKVIIKVFEVCWTASCCCVCLLTGSAYCVPNTSCVKAESAGPSNSFSFLFLWQDVKSKNESKVDKNLRVKELFVVLPKRML